MNKNEENSINLAIEKLDELINTSKTESERNKFLESKTSILKNIEYHIEDLKMGDILRKEYIPAIKSKIEYLNLAIERLSKNNEEKINNFNEYEANSALIQYFRDSLEWELEEKKRSEEFVKQNHFEFMERRVFFDEKIKDIALYSVVKKTKDPFLFKNYKFLS